MIIAREKRKENIAEYILYLYQVEDLIRAFNLDMQLIREHLVKSYNADDQTVEEITVWYENLVIMMEKEDKKEKGHLQFLSNLLQEVNDFHLKLLSTEVDKMYPSVYQAVSGLINELKQRNPDTDQDVRVVIDGIYGYLMLKIQKREIHGETVEAVKRMSNWLAYLSDLFKKYEEGKLEI
jgi:hypothetical protein